MLRNWKVWLGIIVSLIALYLNFRNIDLGALRDSVSNAQLWWFLPATAVLFVALGLRGWRWSALLGGTPFWVTMHAYNIGYMLNMLVPLRAGEVGKAFVIGERTRVSMTRALSSIVVERFFDLASVIALFAIFTSITPMPPEFVTAAMIGGVIVVCMLIGFVLVVWQSARLERFIRLACGLVSFINADRMVARFHDLSDGFAMIGSPQKMAVAIVLTIATWITTIISGYLFMGAFLPPRIEQAGVFITMANLGGALPSAPGGFGVVQYFANQALVIPFGVNPIQAVALAFASTLYQQILLIILGFWGLANLGLQFSSIRKTNAPS